MKLLMLATVAMCHTEKCCPTIYEAPNGDFTVIGKKADAGTRAATASRTAADEDVVTLPREVLLALIANNPSLVAEAQRAAAQPVAATPQPQADDGYVVCR